ncbi:MAG: anthranilate phosphoribosyltransferase [Bryobacterales bacterium]|nr:anthranilate phosphoribosyltransferase [Bryobacteraceae bacterium]MDW8353871.1 anthranilate phosphoribosyltransferase [Bryobacterales bacterium]
MSLLPFLHCLLDRRDLSREQAAAAMTAMLRGEASSAQIAAFLAALRVKGETVDELVGFARAMREHAITIETGLPDGEALLDTCGTGGDGAGTFNISTIAALVAAGAGVRVAKHGNRSISSRCGSADLLESLGVPLAAAPEDMSRALREAGIAFLFAPALHPAMKHAQPARLELKTRTVFNLLGPLTNPARATAQLVGAPSERAARLLAEALAALDLPRGFVVHGSDGLDEITTTGPTLLLEIRDGRVRERTVAPADFGVPSARPDELRGGDRDVNCAIARSVLSGARGPQRDVVLVNAAAALVAAGAARDFTEGMQRAADSVDSGAAWRKLEQLRSVLGAA